MTAHQTEAACLLESGAMYGRRLLLRAAAGEPIFAGLKPGAFSLYFGDAPIYHFDREGRWQRAYLEGIHYLKGLDTKVQAIDRVREGESLVLKRRTLAHVEAQNLDALVRSTSLELMSSLDADSLAWDFPSSKDRSMTPAELREFLARVALWDAPTWSNQRRRHEETYRFWPFLPPDCPSPVVIQATEGHDRGIAFGGAQPMDHGIRTPAQLESHARAVAELLGRRVEQCKSIFLGGADLLRRPVDDIAAYLETVTHLFPTDANQTHDDPRVEVDRPIRLSGVHAFLDRFDSPLPDQEAWQRFARLGLIRVSLGVESGDPEVRAWYRKTWSNDDLATLVSSLKTANIGVGVIVLNGAGGVELAQRHLDETAALVNRLELGRGDIVSLIDAREMGHPRLSPSLPAFTPLAGEAWSDDRSRLRDLLAPVRSERQAKVVPYSLEKQGLS